MQLEVDILGMPIDNEENKILPENLDVPAVKPKRSRPSLEGINSPIVSNRVVADKSSFLDSEDFNSTSRSGKIVLPSMVEKPHGLRNFFTLVLICGAAVGGYFAYLKYGAKKTLTPEQNQASLYQYPSITDNNPPASNNTGIGTSVPGVVVPVATSTPATTTPPVVVTPSGPKIKINPNSMGFLNVRSEPSTAGKVIAKVHPGEVYVYSKFQYDWYQIILPKGQTGWVSGTYVTKQ